MTAVRRVVAVLGLALAAVVGSSIPASASFADEAALSTRSVGTATVAAPGGVAGALTCRGKNATMDVTWTPSGSARVSGYRVTVHFDDGSEQVADVMGAAAGSWTGTISTLDATRYAVRYSVTTLTTYGWFTQSDLTGSFRC